MQRWIFIHAVVIALLAAFMPYAHAAEETLIADDAAAGDAFGYAVAAAGNVVVVGAPGADVNGNADQGAVYVFERRGNRWRQVAKLAALDGSENARFGHAVSICGTMIVIGAPAANANGTAGGGALYVFQRTDGEWRQQSKLAADDGLQGDRFGSSVAVSPARILAGAPRASGDPANVPGFQQGVMYVFDRDGTTWRQTAKLVAETADFGDLFGAAVALRGDIAVIAAEGRDDFAGSAYVFRRGSDGAWRATQAHAPPPYARGASMGRAVAIAGDAAVIGAPFGNGEDALFSGTVYLRAMDGADAGQLTASDWSIGAAFGSALAMTQDRLAVGAPQAGKAYVFERDGDGRWRERGRVESGGSAFGRAVALGDDVLVVGDDMARVDGRNGAGRVRVIDID